VRTFVVRIVHFPFQILIWHTLAAERGFLHSLEGVCLCCCDRSQGIISKKLAALTLELPLNLA
jgi:hypothetical protein